MAIGKGVPPGTAATRQRENMGNDQRAGWCHLDVGARTHARTHTHTRMRCLKCTCTACVFDQTSHVYFGIGSVRILIHDHDHVFRTVKLNANYEQFMGPWRIVYDAELHIRVSKGIIVIDRGIAAASRKAIISTSFVPPSLCCHA